MAKIYGLFGSMKGKIADVVMAVRSGEQIVRKYQPIVYNPSTPAQVATRAKMKLMSQLSAVMSLVIAMPSVGNVSKRNMFIKKNFSKATYNNNEADITLSQIKLTNSVVSLPELAATRKENAIEAALVSSPGAGVSRVVYARFNQMPDNTLRYIGSVTATEAGDNNNWPANFPLVAGSTLFLAYSVRDNSSRARAIFGDMQAVTAEDVANLVATRTLTESDITLSETKGIILQPAA